MIDPAPSAPTNRPLDLTYDSPVVVTGRLVLRPPHLDDEEELAAIANDRRIAEMTSRMPFPYRRSDAREFLERYARGELEGYIYAVTLARNGRLVGVCGLEERERSGGFEIGFWLGVDYWGSGYATEAANALVDQAFRATDAERIYAVCRTVNSPSRNVIRKSGFAFLGLDEIDSLAAGRVPVERYVVDRETWLERKASRRRA